MKKKTFNANYKKYILYYTEDQKAKIDYMNGWRDTIKRLQWLIKNNKIKDKGNCSTSYVARMIDNYSFHIIHLVENQFLIKDGHEWEC